MPIAMKLLLLSMAQTLLLQKNYFYIRKL